MAKSYIGTISRRGLESLFPESEHLERFLVRRAYRRRPVQALCYWAVLDDAPACEIQQHLLDGEPAHALALLSSTALEVGSILPGAMDEVPPFTSADH